MVDCCQGFEACTCNNRKYIHGKREASTFIHATTEHDLHVENKQQHPPS